MTSSGTALRSTAEAQRSRITGEALRVFASTGYYATPVTDVAAAAQVSPAYIFRLFPGKLGLFIAATEYCYQQVAVVLTDAGEHCPSRDPQDRLDAMTAAYVDLIADRDLIMFQVQAQSACQVPEILNAVQRGLGEVVRAVTVTSGASPVAVQHFMAYGQLCHLIVQADLDTVTAEWAETMTAGMQHPT